MEGNLSLDFFSFALSIALCAKERKDRGHQNSGTQPLHQNAIATRRHRVVDSPPFEVLENSLSLPHTHTHLCFLPIFLSRNVGERRNVILLIFGQLMRKSKKKKGGGAFKEKGNPI